MSQMMIQAAVTMGQLQQKLDLIGHNLANSQTTGYKGRDGAFSSLLFQEINNLSDEAANAPGRLTPHGIRRGTGAKLGMIHYNPSQGVVKDTGRLLDVALLDEKHLFQVQVNSDNATEVHYTRDGTFYLSPNDAGNTYSLTTKDGHAVLGVNGPIEVPARFDEINIRDNGSVVITVNGAERVVGQLELVEAVRPRVLEATGENYFKLPENLAELGLNANEIIARINPNDNALQSGALEQSNVDIGEQMTDLLTAQRSYQMNAKTITMGDQMQGLVNQLR